jgi:ABC-type uncharacterized transport system auxiliary subunit
MNKLMILIASLLLFSACSNQPAKVKKYYRLGNLESTQPTTSHSLRTSVIISRPKALSILAGRPMVATQADGALVQLNDHYWLESPTLLLQQHLKNWAQNHWQQVQTNAPFNERHERLDSQIMAFEKDGKLAKVSLHFELVSVDGTVLLDQTFSRSLSIHGEGYVQFVETINRALNLILTDLSVAITNLP